MKILQHTPGQRIELGGDYEHSRWGSGCGGACVLGCLAPVVLALVLMWRGYHDVSPWLLGGWGALSLAGFYGILVFLRNDESCAWLSIDRSRSEVRWARWTGRSSQREFKIGLNDVRSIEVAAAGTSEHRIDVSLTLRAENLPRVARSNSAAGCLFFTKILILIFKLVPGKKRHDRSPEDVSRRQEIEEDLGKSPGEETGRETDTASIDLELDWLQTPDVRVLGVLLSEILGTSYYSVDPDDEDTHVFSRTWSTSTRDLVADQLEEGPFFQEIPASAALENCWDPVKKAVKRGDGSKTMGEGPPKELFLLLVFVASVFLPLFSWEPESLLAAGARDLFAGLLICGIVAAIYKFFTGSYISELEISRIDREIRMKATFGTRVMPFSEIQRVVVFEKSMIIDAERGSLTLPLDLDDLEEDQLRAIALDLANEFGVPAVTFLRPSDDDEDGLDGDGNGESSDYSSIQ